MRIDGLGPPAPVTPVAPAPPPGAAAAGSATSFTVATDAQTLALQQLEQKGGGGGGGHGGSKALRAIDDIAARASLNVTARTKTAADRIRDIATMRAELERADDEEEAGERDPDRREERSGDGAPGDEDR